MGGQVIAISENAVVTAVSSVLLEENLTIIRNFMMGIKLELISGESQRGML